MAQWNIDPPHSSAEFSVKHMGVAWVKGRFTKIMGIITFDPDAPLEGSVVAEIPAESIWTGDEARDNHLRSKDFFDVQNHPKITFKSTRVEKGMGEKYNIRGDLTMRGVTKPVVLETTFLGAQEIPAAQEGKPPTHRAGFTGKTMINRHDFGIAWDMPAGPGIKVAGGEVDITLNIEAVKQ